MKNILNFIFNRLTIVVLLLLIQGAVLVLVIWHLSESFTYVYGAFLLLSFLITLSIIRSSTNPSFKLSWVIFVMLIPVFGGLFYLMFAKVKHPKKMRVKMENNKNKFLSLYPQNEDIIKKIEIENKAVAGQCKYIKNVAKMPCYENTSTKFYSLGEHFFVDLKNELLQAKKYIFLEYFIIHEGIMWDEIVEILKVKASEGVDVRLIYDDAGSINLVPNNYEKILAGFGIKAFAFNPFIPALSIFIQNRDHRKIAVIDGHTAFTGGINLADEYINAYEKHGHWKDCAVRLKGEAVYSMTLMFLENWNFHSNTDKSFDKYKEDAYSIKQTNTKGYSQPYSDSPYDNENIGESIYINIFNNANDYIYINTPYLIINNEVATALILAAKRGVDVRIVTPGIGDKPYVHFTTRSYYEQLIDGGVRIYEYTPGFIHAKTVVSDSLVATVGTVNFDYRSLYHHFECGVFMYNTDAVIQLEDDFVQMLSLCTEITKEYCKKQSYIKRMGQSIMRIVAPLM